MDAPRDIGARLELFVDDWLIDRLSNASLKMHSPVPKEVVFQFDRPWEAPESTFVRTMKDGDTYKSWYRASADRDQCAAYAESDDGINWRRPNLGLVEYEGSRDNNILIRDQGITNLAVFRDDNPDSAEDERYKAIAKGHKIDGRATIRGLVSPDGLRWRVIDRDPILVAPEDRWPMFDSTNVAFWDAVQGQYVAYMRGWIPGPKEVLSDHANGIRWIRRSVSNDFHHWSAPEFIDTGGSPLEHLYTNACVPYHRAPHIYLMFPRRFVVGRKFHEDWKEDGLSDGVFMTSRDGMRWDRMFMEPFIAPGLDTGNWNDRSTTVGVGVLPTGPGEISLYYKQHNRLPSARIRRGALRTDGFVSVSAPHGGGEMITKPLTFDGDELIINYTTSAPGSVSVEVQGADGTPVDGKALSDCVPIFGDEIERTVLWRGGSSLAHLAGRPVRLRFSMVKGADLYSMRFKKAS